MGTSQILAVVSSLAEAMSFPSGEKLMAVTQFLCPSMVPVSFIFPPNCVRQSLISLSVPAVARVSPSGEIETDQTVLLCGSKPLSFVPDPVSKKLACPGLIVSVSPPPAAMTYPFPETAIEVIQLEWPGKLSGARGPESSANPKVKDRRMTQASRLMLTMGWIRILLISVQGPLNVETNPLAHFQFPYKPALPGTDGLGFLAE